MVEFTGERVIPDQVNVDLLNEHMARYMFAARLASGKRVLDAGCGAGYGSAELARTAHRVVGIDRAPEALAFAREHYQAANLEFQRASCAALPFPNAAFDLVVAFEIIEHLDAWREFLLEVRRVLAPAGQFLVSTPNRLYYKESRGSTGANPFHVHEFDFDEFRRELKLFFPHVSMYLENHTEGITFQPHEAGNTAEVRVEAAEAVAAESHFFLAVCADRPLVGNPTFVYVPRAANVLREREHHIVLLDSEIVRKNEWLADAQRRHEELLALFAEQKESLERSNRWAESLNRELDERAACIAGLQQELAREQEAARQMAEGYAAKVAELEADIRDKTQWAIDTETRLTAEVRHQTGELGKAVEALHHTEQELDQRTRWALSLQEEGARLAQLLALVRGSRWVRLGRKVGLGPELPAS
ncbi:MAG TPA: methyltransferase domain-containing protein [Bryobacteraceae bacterium]|nr:methyltransferase domain-containing protein [Bryobacteraceae bacterium]